MVNKIDCEHMTSFRVVSGVEKEKMIGLDKLTKIATSPVYHAQGLAATQGGSGEHLSLGRIYVIVAVADSLQTHICGNTRSHALRGNADLDALYWASSVD